MLTKHFEEKQALRVDERMVTVVRIIVEQYHGDVKAFIESTRYRVKVNRKAQSASDRPDEAVLQHLEHHRPNARQ